MNASGQFLSVTIELGELTWAGTAVPGYYHVQDPATGELHQVMASRPVPWAHRLALSLRRAWSGSRWMKPAAGVAAALAVIGAVGLAENLQVSADAQRQRAVVQAIPFAPAAVEEDAKGDLTIVPAPYAEGAAERSMPQSEPEERPVPRSVVTAAGNARKVGELSPSSRPAARQPLPAAVPAAKPVPRQVSAPPGRAAQVPKEPEKGEPSPVIVNEDRGTRPPDAAPVVARGVFAQAITRSADSGEGGASSATAAARLTRLVAIQDAQTILVTSPTTRLPLQVSVGAALPGGRKLTGVDVSKGLATLDDGTSMRLE